MAIFFKHIANNRVVGIGCIDENPKDYDFHEMLDCEYISEEEYNNIMNYSSEMFSYINKVNNGEIELADVPEYIKADVEYELNAIRNLNNM